MLRALVLLVGLLTTPMGCKAGLVVIDIDTFEGDGQFKPASGELILDKVTMFHPDLGNITWNGGELRAMFLSSRDSRIVCEWLESEAEIDELELNLTGIDLIVSNWDNERCLVRDFDRACMLAPVLLGFDKNRFPGTLSTRIFDWSDEFLERLRFCSILEGHLVNGGLSQITDSIRFHGKLTLDSPEAYELYKSFSVQLLFRVLVPVYYFFVATISVRIFWERKKILGRIIPSHAFVLGLNATQGFGLAILNAIGLHDLGETFSEFVMVAAFSNFFSLSTATDLIFARVLAEVYRGFSFGGRPTQQNIWNWIILAVGIISIEAGCFAVYIANPSVANRVILTKIMPAILMFFSITITIYVVHLMRMVARALVAACRNDSSKADRDPQTVLREKMQVNLAKQYYFWTKISIISVCLVYLGAVLSLLGIMFRSPYTYLTIVFGFDFGKLLNMHAQSMSCRTPVANHSVVSIRHSVLNIAAIQPINGTERTTTRDSAKLLNSEKS